MLSYLNNWNADLGMYRAIFGMRITATTTGTCSACPSTEALNVAEWIYHNTAFDTAKSLIATHAFSITSSNDPKYFQSKSLLCCLELLLMEMMVILVLLYNLSTNQITL